MEKAASITNKSCKLLGQGKNIGALREFETGWLSTRTIPTHGRAKGMLLTDSTGGIGKPSHFTNVHSRLT